MAAKSFLKPYKVVSAGDMSTASITSPVTAIQTIDNIGYQLNWTGTPTGTFNIQVSMDYEPGKSPDDKPFNAGTWTTVTLTVPVVASGSADNAYVDLDQLSAPYIRVVYTRTSGSGSLNAFVTGKAI